MGVMDTGNNIITKNEFKAYLGDTGAANDTKYEQIINAVSARFNLETGRRLKAREITEYRDGDGGTVMRTLEWPIVSQSSTIDIRIDEDRAYPTTDKVTSTNIVIYTTEGLIYLEDDSFESGNRNVKIVYTAGYTAATTTGSTGTMPQDIRHAAKEYGLYLWQRQNDRNVGIRQISGEGQQVTYETDMPWSVRQVLEAYRRRDHG
jgi:hypothetical protein